MFARAAITPRHPPYCDSAVAQGGHALLLLDWVVRRPTVGRATLQVMPDDHSKLVPPLPIPNRTVKRLRADDSAATSVKVGHRQAVIPKNPLA